MSIEQINIIKYADVIHFNTELTTVLVAKCFSSAKRLHIPVTDFAFGARVNISHMHALFLFTITHIAPRDYTKKILI